jgi:ribose transport system substrate-binding protein
MKGTAIGGLASWRLLALVGVAAAIVVGATSALAGGRAADTRTAASKEIGFLLGVQNNPFYEEEACWAKKEAASRGYTVNFQGPAQFDARLSIQVMDALAARKPAGLVVDPVFPQQMVNPIKQLIKSGIPVATIQEEISIPGQITNIVSFHRGLGRIGADLMAKAIGGNGKVFVIDFAAGSQSTDDRRRGFLDGIKKYPGIKYVGNEFTGADTNKSAQVITSVLQRYPDLKGIFGTDLYGIQGAITALQQAGKDRLPRESIRGRDQEQHQQPEGEGLL